MGQRGHFAVERMVLIVFMGSVLDGDLSNL